MSLAPMSFVRTTGGTHDSDTETFGPPTKTQIDGEGALVAGDPQRYEALGLNLVTMPTVLFRPDPYGLRSYTPEFVMPGDVVAINGKTFTAKDIKPVGPDGRVIIARIIVSAGGE